MNLPKELSDFIAYIDSKSTEPCVVKENVWCGENVFEIYHREFSYQTKPEWVGRYHPKKGLTIYWSEGFEGFKQISVDEMTDYIYVNKDGVIAESYEEVINNSYRQEKEGK
jgi:hypothetical protein